jgi:UDP-N-acetylglucosamine--N-acetylmuramyl-(pentapeptide) pyrophosphoryl-undecaprenol N-acetylglucosamine transferase
VRLLLTGGGTGGHVYPALAIAETFSREKDFTPLTTLFVGTKERMESELVPKAGVEIEYVRAAPLERKLSASFFSMLATNIVGFVESFEIVRKMRPDVLIATGGYVTLPVVAAARALKMLGLMGPQTHLVVLEPNAISGLTNRALAPLVDEVWYALPPGGRKLGAHEAVVGTPVRSTMRRPMTAAEGRAALRIDPDRTTVVVMGGSLGAQSINDAMAKLIEGGMPENWQVVLISGRRDQQEMWRRLGWREHVKVIAYLDDPRPAYAAADMVVSRAGASTLGELAATGTPALVIPYPHATADHQTANARAYAAGGAARVIPDSELDAGRLRLELTVAVGAERAGQMRAAAEKAALSDPRAAIVARVKSWSNSNGSTP